MSKCEFHKDEVKFLGFIVGQDGVKVDPSRLTTVTEWPEPHSIHDIQVFMGFTGFFRKFIYQYSDLAAPLNDMLKGTQCNAKRPRKAKEKK